MNSVSTSEQVSLLQLTNGIAGPLSISLFDTIDLSETAARVVWAEPPRTISVGDTVTASQGVTAYAISVPPNFLTSIAAYWKMDEASGDVLDSHGANSLATSPSAPTSTAGRIGGSRRFSFDDRQYVSRLSGADLSTGGAFTLSLWVKPLAADDGFPFPGTLRSTIISKASDIGGAEFRVFVPYNQYNQQTFFAFTVWHDTLGSQTVTATKGGMPISNWYHLVCWFDPAAQQIGIAVDGGEPDLHFCGGVSAHPEVPFYIGTESSTQFFWCGAIDEVGFWKRALSRAERLSLYNYGAGVTYPFTSISTTADAWLNKLVSYWRLDEASGDALDVHGTNHFIDKNAVGTAPGKVVTARDFSAASAHYFTLASGSSLSVGDTDFTLACWVRATTLPVGVAACIISKRQPLSADSEFRIYLEAGQFKFEVHGPGGTAVVASNELISAGIWYCLYCQHDPAANEILLSVNNGNFYRTGFQSGLNTNPAIPMTLGQRGDGTEFWNGQIDEVGFWKRRITAAQRAAFYNRGRGWAYPFSDSISLETALVSYWNFNEDSGPALDTLGPNHLTDVNEISSVLGVLDKARRFEGTPRPYFVRPVSGDITIGDTDVTFACWVNIGQSADNERVIISKWDAPNGKREFQLYLR